MSQCGYDVCLIRFHNISQTLTLLVSTPDSAIRVADYGCQEACTPSVKCCPVWFWDLVGYLANPLEMMKMMQA